MRAPEPPNLAFDATAALEAMVRAKKLHQETGATRGTFGCPRCEFGVIDWSVAGKNGHTRGTCSTPRCIAWIEMIGFWLPFGVYLIAFGAVLTNGAMHRENYHGAIAGVVLASIGVVIISFQPPP